MEDQSNPMQPLNEETIQEDDAVIPFEEEPISEELFLFEETDALNASQIEDEQTENVKKDDETEQIDTAKEDNSALEPQKSTVSNAQRKRQRRRNRKKTKGGTPHEE